MNTISTQYNKALVVVLGAILIPVFKGFGIELDNEFIQALVLLIIASYVYFVPNKKAGE